MWNYQHMFLLLQEGPKCKLDGDSKYRSNGNFSSWVLTAFWLSSKQPTGLTLKWFLTSSSKCRTIRKPKETALFGEMGQKIQILGKTIGISIVIRNKKPKMPVKCHVHTGSSYIFLLKIWDRKFKTRKLFGWTYIKWFSSSLI